MTLAAFAAVTLAMFVGAVVQGGVGFGLNLVAAPILLLVDPDLVPGPALIGGLLISILIAARDHEHLELGPVGRAMSGRIPGTICATIAIARLPERGLAITFGVLVLGEVVVSATHAHLRPTSRTLVVAGFASGFIGTATSIGGPPMAMLYAGEEGGRVRGMLAGFFLFGSLISIGVLAVAGQLGLHHLALSAALVPGIVAGFLVSRHLARYLDQGRTRAAILVVSGLAALSVLVDALL